MKILLVLFVFSTIETKILELNPKDLCVKTSYKCNGIYSFKCYKYCSISKFACDKFSKISNQLNSLAIQKTKLAIDQLFNYFKMSHENLIKNIQQCSNNLEEICLNKQKCMLSFEFQKSIRSFNLTIKCPCLNEHPYSCDHNYCASSRESCHSIKTNQIYNNCKINFNYKLTNRF